MIAQTTNTPLPVSHRQEIERGERFAFGENWLAFLRTLDEARIQSAEAAMRAMLRDRPITGQTFLDVGCGSGLSSLVARRLGARVHSFDYDLESVRCTQELRRRYAGDDPDWTIQQGSVLDRTFMKSLGHYEVVYSWGVLHHTGRMWEAVDAAAAAVAPGGRLFIALYNDLGTLSDRWRWIKKTYNRLPSPLQPIFSAMVMAPQELKTFARLTLSGRPMDYVRLWTQPNDRGMHRWRDVVDWVGGYPYEVAAPDAVFDFCAERGFTLTAMKCRGVGLGCNEFVFERAAAPTRVRALR
jgi:2-polyprenyl-6-hydroxyphenyl methylase/3-demethylubiquinone-9 3-methyltransferase